jgi:hypothetical protein
MLARVLSTLKWFRGKRIVIPLAVAAIVVFVLLGGHQRIVGLAVDGMAGFLLGGSDFVAEESATEIKVAREEPSQEKPFSNAELFSPIGAAEAIAAAVAEQVLAAEAAVPAGGEAPDSLLVEGRPDESSDAVRKTLRAYTASFLRDPFYSLVAAGKEIPTKLLDVSSAKMVGSVWGESGIIALLEDEAGRSYALKVGDRVVNGRVTSVTPASVTFSISVFGLIRSVTLELAEEGEW